MKSLYDGGFNSKQISKYLNFMGMKTPKGKEYYPKLVWVSVDKYKKRLKRLTTNRVVEVVERLSLQQLKILTKPK